MLYKTTLGCGENLVLLHGWGFNSRVFDGWVNRHKHQYKITLIDLPGHGKSSSVAGGLEAWSAEIIKILPKNPILLGWSLGGLLAINIAKQIPISQLILCASSPKFIQTNDWEFGIDQDNFKQFSNALALNPIKGLKRFVSLQGGDSYQTKHLKKTIEDYPVNVNALNQGLAILLESDLRSEFAELKIPKIALLGKKDTLIPKRIQQWYQANNTQTLLFDTGHLPFLSSKFTLKDIKSSRVLIDKNGIIF
jgi:pimeloyl-[acyl-carrier protein] methyl ester esterase